jgi:hypothetical protein
MSARASHGDDQTRLGAFAWRERCADGLRRALVRGAKPTLDAPLSRITVRQ